MTYTNNTKMGFNRRYVTFSGILNQYSTGGVDSVISYVTKPDSIILAGKDLMLNEIVGLCMTKKRDELQKVLDSYIYNK